MALITFVDEHDNVVGAGTKQEAWEKGVRHRIARILLFNTKGKLLIQKRAAHLASCPDKWDQSAAGHVDAGETYEGAAKREATEEIGIPDLQLHEQGKLYTDETDEPGKIKRRFNMLYTTVSDAAIRANPDEVSETRWIMPDELAAWMDACPSDFTQGFVANFKEWRSRNG